MWCSLTSRLKSETKAFSATHLLHYTGKTVRNQGAAQRGSQSKTNSDFVNSICTATPKIGMATHLFLKFQQGDIGISNLQWLPIILPPSPTANPFMRPQFWRTTPLLLYLINPANSLQHGPFLNLTCDMSKISDRDTQH